MTHLWAEIKTAGENMLDFSLCDTDSPVTDAYLLIPLTQESQLVLKHTYYKFEEKTPMKWSLVQILVEQLVKRKNEANSNKYQD